MIHPRLARTRGQETFHSKKLVSRAAARGYERISEIVVTSLHDSRIRLTDVRSD